MIIQKEIDLKKELTTEQVHMLESLKENPVIPDKDYPELTAEQLNQFASVAEGRLEAGCYYYFQ